MDQQLLELAIAEGEGRRQSRRMLLKSLDVLSDFLGVCLLLEPRGRSDLLQVRRLYGAVLRGTTVRYTTAVPHRGKQRPCMRGGSE